MGYIGYNTEFLSNQLLDDETFWLNRVGDIYNINDSIYLNAVITRWLKIRLL